MTTNIYGLPDVEVLTICNYTVNYSLMILVNIIFSFVVYAGYIIIRWKFREKSEELLFWLFMLNALQFSLNIFFFIIQFAPDHGISKIEGKTI